MQGSEAMHQNTKLTGQCEGYLDDAFPGTTGPPNWHDHHAHAPSRHRSRQRLHLHPSFQQDVLDVTIQLRQDQAPEASPRRASWSPTLGAGPVARKSLVLARSPDQHRLAIDVKQRYFGPTPSFQNLNSYYVLVSRNKHIETHT